MGHIWHLLWVLLTYDCAVVWLGLYGVYMTLMLCVRSYDYEFSSALNLEHWFTAATFDSSWRIWGDKRLDRMPAHFPTIHSCKISANTYCSHVAFWSSVSLCCFRVFLGSFFGVFRFLRILEANCRNYFARSLSVERLFCRYYCWQPFLLLSLRARAHVCLFIFSPLGSDVCPTWSFAPRFLSSANFSRTFVITRKNIGHVQYHICERVEGLCTRFYGD